MQGRKNMYGKMGAKKKPSSRRTVFSLVGRDGFEPSKSLTADLQSAPFGHSGTYPYLYAVGGAGGRTKIHKVYFPCLVKDLRTSQLKTIHRIVFLTLLTLSGFESVQTLCCWWSWWTDSNPRPADYKSAALPTELHQRFNARLIYHKKADSSTLFR